MQSEINIVREQFFNQLSNGHKYKSELTLSSFKPRIVGVIVPGSGRLDLDGTIGENKFLRQLSDHLVGRYIGTLRLSKISIDKKIETFESYEDEYIHKFLELIESVKRKYGNYFEYVVIGHSLGGHVAPQIAKVINAVGLVIINSHISPLTNIIKYQLKNTDFIIPKTKKILSNLISEIYTNDKVIDQRSSSIIYFQNASEYNPNKYILSLNIPTLIIGCGQDKQVPVSEYFKYSYMLKQSIKSLSSIYYPNLNHLIMPSKFSSATEIYISNKISTKAMYDINNWFFQNIVKK